MKATFSEQRTNNGKHMNKEVVKTSAVYDVSTKKSAVSATWWMSRTGDGASPIYCTVWADKHSGHGIARGYGYDKLSAALSEAFESAGISTDVAFSGRGERAAEEALIAVAVAQGVLPENILSSD